MGRTSKAPLREEFEQLYIKEDLPQKELAEMFHVTTSTVSRWASMYGLKKSRGSGTMHKEITEERLREMFLGRRMKIRDIAETFGVSEYTIKSRLYTAGIRRRNCPDPVNPGREELSRLYTEERLSLTRIAARYGVSSGTAAKWMDEAGIPRRKNSRKDSGEAVPRGRERNTCPGKAALERLYLGERYTVIQIAGMYGVSTSMVYGWLRKYHINAPACGTYGCPAKEELEGLYLKERLPVREIAERYGVGRPTIYAWLTEAGIGRRGRESAYPGAFNLNLQEIPLFNASKRGDELLSRSEAYCRILSNPY